MKHSSEWSIIPVLALCLVTFMVSSASAATYYLSPVGDDTATGSEDQPWATLEHAAAQAGPGDTVVLASGEYPGVLRPSSGAEGAPVTFRAAERHHAVLTGPESGYAVVLEDAEHVQLEGLAFRPATPEGRWIYGERATSLELTDLHMDECERGSGIRMIDCADVRFTDCTMLGGMAGNMVYISDSERLIFEGCEISGSAHALLLFLPDRSVSDVVIRACVFGGLTGRTLLIDSVDYLLFEDNIIVRGFDGGRSADSRFGYFATNSIFRGSRVYDNWGTRLFSIAPYRDTLDFGRVRVYNNVFHGNSADAVTVRNHDNIQDSIFANNVFSENEPFGSERQIIIHEGNTAEDIQFINNLVEGSIELEGELHAAADLADGEIVRGTVAGAPGFTNADAWEHLPAAGSPLIDAGAFFTQATADGEGQRLVVEDAQWFYDGYGLPGERGDLIAVGTADNVARIISADYDENVLELDRALQWGQGDPVSLPWTGHAPDIGVVEAGAENLVPPVVVANPYPAEPGEIVTLRAIMPTLPADATVRWHLTDGTVLEGAEVRHSFEEGEWGLRVRVECTDGEVVRAAGSVVVERPRGADEPLIHSTFGPEDTEAWWRWQAYRPGDTEWRRGEINGLHAMHVRAPEDNRWMPLRTNPRNWDIDRDSLITVHYRISEGAPVGAYVEAFPNHEGTRRVWLAGTEAAMPLPGGREDVQVLIDDGQWHTLHLDARAIREQWPDVTIAQRFAFEGQWQTARSEVSEGDEFWVSEVIIGPNDPR